MDASRDEMTRAVRTWLSAIIPYFEALRGGLP
jgi:hypothetical protein